MKAPTYPRRSHGSHLRRTVTALALACCATLALSSPAHAAPTVVSFNFDMSAVNWSQAAPLLESFGMRGTFFANSCLVQGTPRTPPAPTACPSGVTVDAAQMSWPMLHDLYARGHEIGAHTLNRLYAQVPREDICPDRVNLMAQGFAVTSFAYATPGLPDEQQTARGCGYNSARLTHGVRSLRCPACPFAQALPPANPYRLAVVEHGDSSTLASDMATQVQNAADNGGGWVIFSFNAVCATCRHRTATLTEFLTWLRDSAPAGTTVATNDQVIGGALQPSPNPGATTPAPRPGSAVVVPSGIARDTIAPQILTMSLTRRAFTKRKGTVVRYSLSELSKVTIAVQQRVAGRRVGKLCRPTKRSVAKAKRSVAKAKRCQAYRTVGTLTDKPTKLSSRVTFRGRTARIARKKGSYRFRAVARDRAGNRSKARTVTFRLK